MFLLKYVLRNGCGVKSVHVLKIPNKLSITGISGDFSKTKCLCLHVSKTRIE